MELWGRGGIKAGGAVWGGASEGVVIRGGASPTWPRPQMVSLASDVQELREAGQKEVTSEETEELIGCLQSCPGLVEILCYSYCYLGLLTGEAGALGASCGEMWGTAPGRHLWGDVGHSP